jgi:hypothetical protein
VLRFRGAFIMTGTHAGRPNTSTKRRSAIGLLGTASVLLSLGVMSSPASSSISTAGAWSTDPAQSYSDSTTTAPGPTVYKTAVRPPINADGSSNFAAKRGVIPVQFDVLAATSTVTTTTRTYAPPVWQSIGGTADPSDDYTGAFFVPSTPMTVADIANLSANYVFTSGDCFGGSLRWTIDTPQGQVYAYYGTPGGSDQGCSGSNSGSGQNLITTGITPLRFEVQGAGSPVYIDYASAMALAGTRTVNYIGLVLDSGWKANQTADVSNVTVNDNTWVPKTTENLGSTTDPGAFAKTCNIPAAMMKVYKADNTATGAINETTDSVQLKDSGVYFRQVDCKYIYNLDVSTLTGVGSYKVYANIGGVNVANPAVFDLR